MEKKSKLAEKPTRIPDIEAAAKELAIQTYRKDIEHANSESAKSQRFTLLLQALFGVQPGFIEDYVQGIETYLKMKGKDRIIRGSADQLSGNLIIEFEKELASKAKLEEAEGQLRTYTACSWSQEKPEARTKFVCLATDGRRFRAYSPVVTGVTAQPVEPEGIKLALLENVDATKLKWDDFYQFLDRYLLRKETLHPTSERIVRDFGPNSHAFQVSDAALLAQWNELRNRSDYAVLYDAWDKYLRIVYGSSLADQELFVRHTYLATLAKLMVWSRLVSSHDYPSEGDIVSLLEGTYFKEQLGIENFLEEDFFSWTARQEARKATIQVVRPLLGLLRNYNLREISEDVLKSLYEGLVDPATRHDLGEYYTPDWLAHRIVRKVIEPNPKASVLDPACGSGTFLYMTIREKRHILGDSVTTLKHILSSVVGMDIHPLACAIAKANYVLAMGDLMAKRKQKVSVPIYLANSIRPPELERAREFWQKVECYRTLVDDKYVHIPAALINDPEKYDQAIEAARDFAGHSAGKQTDATAFAHFINANHKGLIDDSATLDVLYSVCETLQTMITTGRDTIWAFVLKNIYKPLFLRERFDLVVGNPPWLSYRYVERSDYQRFLKDQITKKYGLVAGRAELITHLELATLFLAASADIYLKPGARIAFVLPKSVFSADQHDLLRRGQIKGVKLSCTGLWDVEGVSPLFNISAAVYFGEKKRGESGPIPGEIIDGELENRNASLDVAETRLNRREASFELSIMGKGSYWSSGGKVELAESPYRKLFRQGATMVPRCFWFVDLKESQLGFNEALPPLASSRHSQKDAKKAYKGCLIDGTPESKFIYATLLPADMVPFGVLRFSPILLPAECSRAGVKLYSADQARRNGFVHLADWLDKVQQEWLNRGGTKTKQIDAVAWLNYRKKLTEQIAHDQYRIIYATSGTHVCACVVSEKMLKRGLPDMLKSAGFFVDYTTYYVGSASSREAHFLAAILNAKCIDASIKNAQAKGLWGARHVCKKVLDMPIPRFDETLDKHVRLGEIGQACAKRVEKWMEAGGPGRITSIGVLRGRVRELLSAEMAEIDSIVKPMVGL